jgi:hypothetical protein
MKRTLLHIAFQRTISMKLIVSLILRSKFANFFNSIFHLGETLKKVDVRPNYVVDDEAMEVEGDDGDNLILEECAQINQAELQKDAM